MPNLPNLPLLLGYARIAFISPPYPAVAKFVRFYPSLPGYTQLYPALPCPAANHQLILPSTSAELYLRPSIHPTADTTSLASTSTSRLYFPVRICQDRELIPNGLTQSYQYALPGGKRGEEEKKAINAGEGGANEDRETGREEWS